MGQPRWKGSRTVSNSLQQRSELQRHRADCRCHGAAREHAEMSRDVAEEIEMIGRARLGKHLPSVTADRVRVARRGLVPNGLPFSARAGGEGKVKPRVYRFCSEPVDEAGLDPLHADDRDK